MYLTMLFQVQCHAHVKLRKMVYKNGKLESIFVPCTILEFVTITCRIIASQLQTSLHFKMKVE